jgi:hypothetical protein
MIHLLRNSLAALALAACLAGPALSGQPLCDLTGHIDTTQGAVRTIATEDLDKIGRTEISTTVISLGTAEHKVAGVLVRDLLRYVGGTGQSLHVTALDGYAIDIPLSDFESYDVVLATEIDGKGLSVRDKGPAWLIYPVSQHRELDDTVYESRSVWQIKTIEVD